MTATFVLKPSGSKRLIAHGIAALPEVIKALAEATIIIANGTTNAFVAEQLCGRPIADKLLFAAGLITTSGLDQSPIDQRLNPIVLRRGEIIDTPWLEALVELQCGDVFIKGANAIDGDGTAGVLVASDRGGTIGAALGTVTARGIPLIVPAGLEKLVPCVADAVDALGIYNVDLSTGLRCGMVPITNAVIITELEACRILFDVTCTHVASGGVAGAEGSVVIAAQGADDNIHRLMEFVSDVRGEPDLNWQEIH